MDKQYCINRRIGKLTAFKSKAVVFLFAIFIGIFGLGIGSAIAEGELLTADQAFSLTANLNENNTVKLHYAVAPGYYLYQKHFQFQTLDGKPIEAPSNLFPPSVLKRDEVLGDFQVYHQDIELILPLSAKTSTAKQGLRVLFQGCSEGGFCYTPIAKQVLFSAGGIAEITDISPELFNAPSNTESNANQSTKSAPAVSETDFLANQIKSGNFPLTLLMFLGLGLLLAFTPCVLPMIPIMANILVGKETPLTTGRACFLATLYVLSMALCYALAGVLAGLLGNHLQTALQQPVFLVLFSLLIGFFALTQFNLIHIPLPSVLTNFSHNLQQKQKEGSALGAIVMGGLSAVIASPCVTPALVGALVYIGDTGNAVLGGFALFALALGMGLPLLCVACIGSHLLPKAGAWMVYIRGATGVLLLVLSVSILLRAFPMIPTPFSGEIASVQKHFTLIQNEDELKTAIAAARTSQKPIILDVYADWCVSCKELDREVFANKEVLSTLKNTKLLRLDITKQTAAIEHLKKNLEIVGPPTLLFFGSDGEEVKHYRLIGKIESGKFLDHVNRFLTSQK